MAVITGNGLKDIASAKKALWTDLDLEPNISTYTPIEETFSHLINNMNFLLKNARIISLDPPKIEEADIRIADGTVA